MDAPHIPKDHLSVSMDALYHRLHDDGVIPDAHKERYFEHNQTGAFVWEAFDRNDSLAKMAKNPSDEFGVALNDAHRDVLGLIAGLERNGFIKRSNP